MRRIAAALGALSLTVGLAACGGGGERQDADAPTGDFPIDVVSARFPTDQHLAGATHLQLEIRNVGSETIPNLAVTIWTGEQKADGSFNELLPNTPSSPDDPSLANPSRPVWILEDGWPKALTQGQSLKDLEDAPSAGAVAAQTDTFQFGELAVGDSKTMVWKVTPIKQGTYTVHYEVAPDLQGKATATEKGVPVEDQTFEVTISDRPPQTCVDEAGKVVPEGNCDF